MISGLLAKQPPDGLAVGRPFAFVGKVVEPLLSGICTIEDYRLYDLMRMLLDSEQIFIEPSACAAFAALLHHNELGQYINAKGLDTKTITHIAWATGGSMVPPEMVELYLNS